MNQSDIELMGKMLIELPREMEQIMEKYKSELEDLPDHKKELIVNLIKDVFSLGAEFGIKVQKEM